MTTFGPASVALAMLAAMAASIGGVAAIWLACGRASLLARVAPLALLLAAYVPLGAYEMVALHGAQAATVLIVLGILARWRRLRAASSSTTALAMETTATRTARAQFRLRELLQWMILAALLMSILRLAGPSTASTGTTIVWWPWLIAGTWLGALTLLGLGLARRYPRVAWGASIGAVVFCAAGVALALFVNPDRLKDTFAVAGTLLAPAVTTILAPNLLTPAMVALVLLAGEPWTRDRLGYTNRVDRRVWFSGWLSQFIAQGLVGGWLAFSLWALGTTYVELIPPPFPKLEPLPVPNGYDELVNAGNQLNWAAIPSQDLDAASVADCQQFVLDNSQALALMRAALSKECRCPIVYSGSTAMTRLNAFAPLRSLARALSVEIKSLEQIDRALNVAAPPARALMVASKADTEIDANAALSSNLDLLRLARALSGQGIAIDQLVEHAIEGIGLLLIEDQFESLDGPDLTRLTLFLEDFVPSREPVEQVLERDRVWGRLNYGWHGYLMAWLTREIQREPDVSTLMPQVRARNDVQIQLIIAEAAIRRHVLETGAPPESLERLVPKYLSRVPADPYREGPLVYRRTEGGYLLYSVGRNGIDDGGQRVTFYEAVLDGIGDVFFHVSHDPPEDPPVNQEPAGEEEAETTPDLP